MFYEVAGHDTLICVVANKKDLIDKYDIKIGEAKEWTRQHDYLFFDVSAKTGYER